MAKKEKLPKTPEPTPGSVKHKKSPIKDKKFKKNTEVEWITRVNGVLTKRKGTVVLTVTKGKKATKMMKKLNLKTNDPKIMDSYHTDKTRPKQSFIVSVTNRKGKNVLYWPDLSKLEKQVS